MTFQRHFTPDYRIAIGCLPQADPDDVTEYRGRRAYAHRSLLQGARRHSDA